MRRVVPVSRKKKQQKEGTMKEFCETKTNSKTGSAMRWNAKKKKKTPQTKQEEEAMYAAPNSKKTKHIKIGESALRVLYEGRGRPGPERKLTETRKKKAGRPRGKAFSDKRSRKKRKTSRGLKKKESRKARYTQEVPTRKKM